MNKRLAFRTSVAGIAAAAMTATAIVSPVATADTADTAPAGDADTGTVVEDKQETPEAVSGEKENQGESTTPTFSDTQTKPVAGTGVGLGLLTVLLNIVQVPQLKELNTNIQKQLGIFNPQQAARAEKVAPILVGGTALAGTILSILYLIDVTKPELLKDLKLPYAENHNFDLFPNRANAQR